MGDSQFARKLPDQSSLFQCVRADQRESLGAFSNRSRGPPELARCRSFGQSPATSFPGLPPSEYPIPPRTYEPWQYKLQAANRETRRERLAILQIANPWMFPARPCFPAGFAARRASALAPLASALARSLKPPRPLRFPGNTPDARPENLL